MAKGSWVAFFCAVKRIINTSPAMHKLIRQEYSVFLNWIYYHEVVAEFTVRHWHVPYQGCGFAPVARSLLAIEVPDSRVRKTDRFFFILTVRQEEETIGCPIDVLQLLTYACRQAILPTLSEINEALDQQNRAMALEGRISMTIGDYGPTDVWSATQPDRQTMITNLHRLACLLYTNRAVHRVSGSDFRHRRLVREGIFLLSKMETCQHAWPLFIIACEAVDDNQRLAIMHVFEKTHQDRTKRSAHIQSIQHLVESVWKQHDLDEENQVEYIKVFDAVIGALPFLPAFA